MRFLVMGAILAITLSGCGSQPCMSEGEVGKVIRLSSMEEKRQCYARSGCTTTQYRKAAIKMKNGIMRYCTVDPIMISVGDDVQLYRARRID